MKVKDFMTKGIVTCYSNDSIDEIAEIMDANNIGFVAVCDDDEEIIGVITDRDIVIGPVMDNEKSIEDFYSNNIISIEENSDVDEALSLMKENKVERLLVTKKGKYTGVLSIFDLLEENDTKDIITTLKEIKG